MQVAESDNSFWTSYWKTNLKLQHIVTIWILSVCCSLHVADAKKPDLLPHLTIASETTSDIFTSNKFHQV
jgi:hypothetical protein